MVGARHERNHDSGLPSGLNPALVTSFHTLHAMFESLKRTKARPVQGLSGLHDRQLESAVKNRRHRLKSNKRKGWAVGS